MKQRSLRTIFDTPEEIIRIQRQNFCSTASLVVENFHSFSPKGNENDYCYVSRKWLTLSKLPSSKFILDIKGNYSFLTDIHYPFLPSELAENY